jgi:hypothetical protein
VSELSVLVLRPDPLGSVEQIHREELDGGDKERPGTLPKIMLEQTDSGIKQLQGAGMVFGAASLDQTCSLPPSTKSSIPVGWPTGKRPWKRF